MKVIGLTGGIGSGKSTVSQYMAELGAVIIDADKVGHEAFEPDTPAWHDVVAAFGEGVVAPGGEIRGGFSASMAARKCPDNLRYLYHKNVLAR